MSTEHMTAEQLRAELEKLAHKMAEFRCAGSSMCASSVHMYMGQFAEQAKALAARLSGMAAARDPIAQPMDGDTWRLKGGPLIKTHMLVGCNEWDDAGNWLSFHTLDEKEWRAAHESGRLTFVSPASPEPPHG